MPAQQFCNKQMSSEEKGLGKKFPDALFEWSSGGLVCLKKQFLPGKRKLGLVYHWTYVVRKRFFSEFGKKLPFDVHRKKHDEKEHFVGGHLSKQYSGKE